MGWYSSIKNAAKDAGDAAGGMIEDAGDAVGEVLDEVGGAAQDTGAAMGGGVSGLLGALHNNGASIGGAFGDAKRWADRNFDANVDYDGGKLSGNLWLGVVGAEGSVDVDPRDGNLGIEQGVSAGYGNDRIGVGITQEVGVTTPGQFGLDQGGYIQGATRSGREEFGPTINVDRQDGQYGLDAGPYHETNTQYGTLRTEEGVSVNFDGSSNQGGFDVGAYTESYGDTFFGHSDERYEAGAGINGDLSGGIDVGLYAEGPHTRGEHGVHFGAAGGESLGIGFYNEVLQGFNEERIDGGIGVTGPYAESERTEPPAEGLVSAITDVPAEPALIVEESLALPELVRGATTAIDVTDERGDGSGWDVLVGDQGDDPSADNPTTLMLGEEGDDLILNVLPAPSTFVTAEGSDDATWGAPVIDTGLVGGEEVDATWDTAVMPLDSADGLGLPSVQEGSGVSEESLVAFDVDEVDIAGVDAL